LRREGKHEGTHQRAERDEGAAANEAHETMRGRARTFLSSPAHPHHEHVPDTARLLKNPVGRREYAAADYCSDGDADYVPQLQRAFQFVVSNSSCPIIRTCAAARRAEIVAITDASMRKCDAMA
jgi:hypothetical protein